MTVLPYVEFCVARQLDISIDQLSLATHQGKHSLGRVHKACAHTNLFHFTLGALTNQGTNTFFIFFVSDHLSVIHLIRDPTWLLSWPACGQNSSFTLNDHWEYALGSDCT